MLWVLKPDDVEIFKLHHIHIARILQLATRRFPTVVNSMTHPVVFARVHCVCSLSAGYKLKCLLKNALIFPPTNDQLPSQLSDAELAASFEISSSYSFVKGLLAILQNTFASANCIAQGLIGSDNMDTLHSA
jgi:hypothetical protein